MTELNNEAPGNEQQRMDEMISILKEHNIPVDTWDGLNGTKTAQDLFNELEEGNTALVFDGEKIYRHVRVVAVDIRYVGEQGTTLHLVETRQVSKRDGSVKVRSGLQGSVSEKMETGESPEVAAKRGVKEELGIEENHITILSSALETKTKPAQTYPGLDGKYDVYIVQAKMDESGFVPNNTEGYAYKEEQKHKTTYFAWEREN